MTPRNQKPAWEDMVDRTPAQPAPPPRPPREKLQKDSKDRAMAAYMTHELRAPLTSIRSALGILDMQMAAKLAPEEKQILMMATRNADRLDALINDIMDFTKIRAGKLDMALEAVRPEELIEEVLDSLRSWAVQKGIRLVRTENDEPLPRVNADRLRGVQVLTNLLSNAIKFTPAGGRIAVSASIGRYDHHGTITFSVRDSGPGIPAADVKRIFRSFEQSALGSKAGSGTGLGLTLAKAMVELMGGRIWAEGWKGLGATFRFTLPIFSGDTTAPARPYPKPIEYHGILVGLYKRLNSVVAALFT